MTREVFPREPSCIPKLDRNAVFGFKSQPIPEMTDICIRPKLCWGPVSRVGYRLLLRLKVHAAWLFINSLNVKPRKLAPPIFTKKTISANLDLYYSSWIFCVHKDETERTAEFCLVLSQILDSDKSESIHWCPSVNHQQGPGEDSYKVHRCCPTNYWSLFKSHILF